MASDAMAGTLLVVAAALVVSMTASPVGAHPPNETDHGVPERTFHTLWAGDRDGTTQEHGSSMAQLAHGTDVPLDAPPGAVERWNRGDHRDFPATNRSVSIHPPDADLADGRVIRDAYAEIFAVQPSTRARVSPSRQPRYVAPNGTLRGTVDYRVVVPAANTTGDRRVAWQLERHAITETTLLVDGEPTTTGDGSHIPALPYTLGGAAGDTHRLTLQATITVRLRKTVEVCTERDDNGTCTDWRRAVTYLTENITVADTTEVTTYDLAVSGFIAQYPNGDLGLVVYKNQPWLGYELPDGDVRGVWRFYAARDTDWDRLVYSAADGQRTTHSPLHPLQVNAYPIETGPTPTPRRTVTILDVYGTSTRPPTLPSRVNLDVLSEPYTASYGIATRTATTERPDTVRAWGLVRGVDAAPETASFFQIPIHESNLTLTVMNRTASTVTVRARLANATSGAPINTAERGGYIVVNGRQVNTTGNGTVTTTLPRPTGGVSARYDPGDWWVDPPGYTGDTATVLVQGSVLRLVSTLFRLGVPVGVFLLAVYLIDRITGWRLWPPWRRL